MRRLPRGGPVRPLLPRCGPGCGCGGAAVEDPVMVVVTRVVSEMTGYPPELLDPDLDLEADLGVDTVKQAEVFAAVREEYGLGAG